MSKIFEALKKTDGEAADFSLPLISSNTSAAAVATEPEQPEQPAMPEATAVGGDEPIPEANPVAEESVRVVSIRPAKDAPGLPFDGAHPAVSRQYRIIRTPISQHPPQP